MAQEWTPEMLNQLASVVAENGKQIARNGEQIAKNSEQIGENTAAIKDLRIMMNELREGQALLIQMFQEEREAFREFRQITNAALDRIDRTLERLEPDRS